MSTRNPVYRETAAIAIGEVLCVGLMLGIYALAGRLDRSVVLGGMLGGFSPFAISSSWRWGPAWRQTGPSSRM